MKISAIHHISLLISDLARSRNFYENILCLSPANRPPLGFDGVWYDIAPKQQIHLLLLPNPQAGLPRPAHGGRDQHLALAVENLSRVMEKLDAAGIVYTLSQSGRRALFCRDPDLNVLEFIEVEK